ncbi:MAG: glycosyltransferase family 4 protein [bacterium]
MNILLLAPHPFFQERGTPIAVNLLLKVLSGAGHRVDILTYHLGEDVTHLNVTIHRIRGPLFIKNVRPGFSLKKLICDLYMIPKAVKMARCGRYDVIHAVEESVFIARIIRRITGIPYVYDMDSSLPAQMVEKMPFLVILRPLMRWFEKRAISRAAAVIAVCDSLASIAKDSGGARVVVLNDISLLDPAPENARLETRESLRIAGLCFIYIGNLESYQGIDLLLESFAILLETAPDSTLVVAGGTDLDVASYRKRAENLGIANNVRFIGRWPVNRMSTLMAAADVLVSPRLTGNNTPMKIYSYLDSGKPVLATAMAGHTQVLDQNTAVLSPPDPVGFAAGMLRLVNDPALREGLGARGKALATKKYSFDAFKATIINLYASIEAEAPNAHLNRSKLSA